jgi:3-dehydroquinate dehydratase-2
MRKILLLLGAGVEAREPAQETTMTAAGLEAMLREHAAACGFDLEIFYANSEADAVERLSQAAEVGVEGVMIDPGDELSAGNALRDCMKEIAVPCIEVHSTNIHRRGISLITAGAADGFISGLGSFAYVLGLDALRELLEDADG